MYVHSPQCSPHLPNVTAHRLRAFHGLFQTYRPTRVWTTLSRHDALWVLYWISYLSWENLPPNKTKICKDSGDAQRCGRRPRMASTHGEIANLHCPQNSVAAGAVWSPAPKDPITHRPHPPTRMGARRAAAAHRSPSSAQTQICLDRELFFLLSFLVLSLFFFCSPHPHYYLFKPPLFRSLTLASPDALDVVIGWNAPNIRPWRFVRSHGPVKGTGRDVPNCAAEDRHRQANMLQGPYRPSHLHGVRKRRNTPCPR